MVKETRKHSQLLYDPQLGQVECRTTHFDTFQDLRDLMLTTYVSISLSIVALVRFRFRFSDRGSAWSGCGFFVGFVVLLLKCTDRICLDIENHHDLRTQREWKVSDNE